MLSLLMRFCLYIKHRILEYAHPMPQTVRVFAGPAGSVERAVIEAVMDFSFATPREGCPGEDRPTLWVDDEWTGVYGWMPICRYLGLLWRAYPTTPLSALYVDGALDLLARFLQSDVPPADRFCAFVTQLELRLEKRDSDDPWLEGFDSKTIADMCWHAALTHHMEEHTLEIDEEQHPLVFEWMCAMEGAPPLHDDPKDD